MKNLFKILLSIFFVAEDIPDSATEFSQKANESKNRLSILAFLIVFWISFVSLIITTFISISKDETFFNVIAVTQYFELKQHTSTDKPLFYIESAKLHPECDEKYYPVKKAELSLHESTILEFLRLEKSRMYITVTSDEVETSGKIVTSEGAKKLSDCSVFEIAIDDKGITLPLDGEIVVGSPIKAYTNKMPILLSGQVSIADKGYLSNEFYLSEPYELTIGDRFLLENQTTQSAGLVHVSTEPGMKLTFSVKGQSAYIEKYKSERIKLENSIWRKLIGDPTLIVYWSILLGLYGLIKTALRFIVV